MFGEKSKHEPGRDDLPKEFEVVVAEIETRLRESLLRMIRPSLAETSRIAARMDLLAEKVKRHEVLFENSESLRQEVHDQMQVFNAMQEQQRWNDKHLSEFQSRTTSDIIDLRSKNDQLQLMGDSLKLELSSNKRRADQLCDETVRLQNQHEESMKLTKESIVNERRKAEEARDQIWLKISQIDARAMELHDDLFGEDKGLVKLRSDLTKLEFFVKPLPDIEEEVKSVSRRFDTVEERQCSVESSISVFTRDFSDFKGHMSRKFDVFKEEFRAQSNKLTGHHNALLQDIRSKYDDELRAARKSRERILELETSIHKYCEDLRNQAQSESSRIDSLHRELTHDIEETHKKRKKDRIAIDAELREIKKEIHGYHDHSHNIYSDVEHIGRIMGLVIEAQRVSSSLQVQDFADRSCECWLTVASDKGRRPCQSLTAEALLHHSGASDGDGKRVPDYPTLVDVRKGHLKTEYLPGLVSFNGDIYDRKDILIVQHKLLTKAHDLLDAGMPTLAAATSRTKVRNAIPLLSGSSSADHERREEPLKETLDAVVPMQPGASGGTAGAQTVHASRHSKDFDSSWPSGSTQRQRPGSQGQPQGTGSRGSMFGSLGETMPPLEVSPLKLPSIGGADRGAGPDVALSTTSKSFTAR